MTNLPFERKSKVNTSSDNYLDANGNYVYTRMVRQPNGKWEREVIDVVPLTAENMECLIVLEENDHDVNLAERYDAENADYGFLAQKEADEGDQVGIQQILLRRRERFDECENLFHIRMLRSIIIKYLNCNVVDLGERKFLEDIRREEEAATGKKIIAKACKYFGVEKPKQAHRQGG